MFDSQRRHWEEMFARQPGKFGTQPSYPAQTAAELFAREGSRDILELGAGEGRDTLLFAQRGFSVTVLDFSTSALERLTDAARKLSLLDKISVQHHDIRLGIPVLDNKFDACYSHMLYCMAFDTEDVRRLSREVCRVLKPGGLNIYTVRTTDDPDYGHGAKRGHHLYEDDGCVIRFFDLDDVNQLNDGFDMVKVDQFDEGPLPRKLFLVIQRKRK